MRKEKHILTLKNIPICDATLLGDDSEFMLPDDVTCLMCVDVFESMLARRGKRLVKKV